MERKFQSQKNMFLHFILHECKQPMSVISLGLDFLQSQTAEILADVSNEDAADMKDVVNDMATASKFVGAILRDSLLLVSR